MFCDQPTITNTSNERSTNGNIWSYPPADLAERDGNATRYTYVRDQGHTDEQRYYGDAPALSPSLFHRFGYHDVTAGRAGRFFIKKWEKMKRI